VALPTRRGTALLFTALGTYMAARLVGTWELYLVALALGAAVLVAWVLVAVTARGLEGERTVSPERPIAGDPVSTGLRVANGSILPGVQLTVPDPASGLGHGRGELHVESLGPHGRRWVTSRPEPARRGVHFLPALRARAEDPLGLAGAERRLGDPLEVTVHPKLVHLSSCVLWPDMGTRHERGRRGHAMLGAADFRGVRPHNPGEPLSHIDWKSTAKTGELMLREMDDPASGEVTVLLDASTALVVGDPPDTNFERAVQVAGSIADFALRAGRGVSLLLPEDQWRPARLTPGVAGRERLRDALARVAPRQGHVSASLRTLLGAPGKRRRTPIVALVVLALDSELAHAAVALRRLGLQVSVIHVTATAAEEPLPAEARDLSLALAAAGVSCLTVHRDDDLHAALSSTASDARRAVFR